MMIEKTGWTEGYCTSEDTQCYVTCSCGEQFSIADHEITYCKCGLGYITEFRVYRIFPRKI